MTTQTVGTAVEKASTESMVTAYQSDFATVLPSHIKPETWVRLAVGALRRNEKLKQAAQANPGSLMVALLDAARKGLEPGTEEYYLTPRKTKGGGLEVLGITGYQGEVEMIYRAGAVSSVIVEVVHEADTFSYRPGDDDKPHHEIDWKLEDRGALCLVYAYAKMRDGAISKVVVLNKADIARSKSYSQGADGEYSPWRKHEKSMWLKTAAHQLKKWVPTSAEYRQEQMRAALEAQKAVDANPQIAAAVVPDGVDADTGEIVEGVLLDDGTCPDCGGPNGDHDLELHQTMGIEVPA